jgi:dsRNA-specific ribonuclease
LGRSGQGQGSSRRRAEQEAAEHIILEIEGIP